MQRRPFTVFAVLSLPVLVALGAMWVRSYWVTDFASRFNYADDHRDVRNRTVASWRGVLAYTEEQERIPVCWQTQPTFGTWQHRAEAPSQDFYSLTGRPTFWSDLGFTFRTQELSWRRAAGDPWVPWLVVAVPYWLVVVPFSILPAIWLASTVRRRRLGRGFDVNFPAAPSTASV